jgi:hypothetical protein
MFPNAKIWKHFSIFTYINKLVDNNKMMKIGAWIFINYQWKAHDDE